VLQRQRQADERLNDCYYKYHNSFVDTRPITSPRGVTGTREQRADKETVMY